MCASLRMPPAVCRSVGNSLSSPCWVVNGFVSTCGLDSGPNAAGIRHTSCIPLQSLPRPWLQTQSLPCQSPPGQKLPWPPGGQIFTALARGRISFCRAEWDSFYDHVISGITCSRIRRRIQFRKTFRNSGRLPKTSWIFPMEIAKLQLTVNPFLSRRLDQHD